MKAGTAFSSSARRYSPLLECIRLLLLPAAALSFGAPPSRNNGERFRPLAAPRHMHQTDGEQGLGLYVHIPYCRRRCNYCDFAIIPVGAAAGGEDARRAAGFEAMDAGYKDAVLAEIVAIGRRRGEEEIPLKSVYFGGGTPSLAPLSTLRDLMRSIHESRGAPFRLAEDAELTMEMDPGTFDLAYLSEVKGMGFNRISLGVQSFDDRLLEHMGRVHRCADVYRSVDLIGQVFGEDADYSIDLISGVPGLTPAGWTETLHEAVRLRPPPAHMSLYDLQVEGGTTFGRWYRDAEGGDGQSPKDQTSRPALPSAEDSAFMYSYASGYLRSRGYEHYEISSYARAGGSRSRRSRHNQIYWEYDGQWHAVGLGATSRIDGFSYARPRALSDYISWAGGLGGDGGDGPPWMSETNGAGDEDDDLLDVVMTRLRTSEGLDLDWVAGRDGRGEACVEAILRGFELALDLNLGVRDMGSSGKFGCVRLNDPKGFLFSNNIISNIFVELSEVAHQSCNALG